MSINKLVCPYPANISPLSSGGFMLDIQKSPQVRFWCQEVALPDITLDTTTFSTPLNIVKQPGDNLQFGALNVQFLIDSNMDNYIELWNWMNGLGFPEDHAQFQTFINQQPSNPRGNLAKTVSDGTLSILNNSNNVIRNIQFIDMFPTSLSSLTLQATNTDVTYLVGNVTFDYSHYKFI
ncbi:tail completion and sheath stabilizer protein [uncultured Caudovirales phage]|uniref:Tail completion and sheath stabilizer protein n=1 Tax=uncultured Caudovirales phage TaxID=2100421 RepID=A0A6J5KTV8_9CAUD|nr:tail completion and sheath stabilizer protein [uncultured Caudovirales phage]